MAELVEQRFDVIPSQGEGAGVVHRQPVNLGEEVDAKMRLGWFPQLVKSVGIQMYDPDPHYSPWPDMVGWERYVEDLAMARSKPEMNALKAQITANNRDHDIASRGPLGIVGDLVAGVFDPANLIPIPAVKGIGLLKGALTFGVSNLAIGAGAESLRQYADPTARPEEAFGNIALAGLIGAGLGAPIGAWGARATRRANALRNFERGMSDIDHSNPSMAPLDMNLDYSPPPGNYAAGERPRIATRDAVTGYKVREDGDESFAFTDETGWIYAADQGVDLPRPVPDEVLARLGLPESNVVRKTYVDDVMLRREHNRGNWHDELQSRITDDIPIDQVIRSADDYVHYRIYEHAWQNTLTRNVDEPIEAFNQRVGENAMQQLRASKASMGYAGPNGLIAWALERANFSPLAKGVRVFDGDNVIATTFLRIAGDNGWALKAGDFGWATPPSMLMESVRHMPRWAQFVGELDQEFARLMSGDPDLVGRQLQGANISAAGYALKQGLRKLSGAHVLTKADFEEMVAEAVFNPNHFETNGFPVNEHARKAAAAYTKMMREYDDLHRAVGNFRQQKDIVRDIARWKRDRQALQNRVMQWLFGATGEPSAYQTAIRVSTAGAGRDVPGQLLQEFSPIERVFPGETYEDAIQAMIDALGDEGMRLSENLGPDNYVYVRRPPEQRGMAALPRLQRPANENVPIVERPDVQPELFGRRRGSAWTPEKHAVDLSNARAKAATGKLLTRDEVDAWRLEIQTSSIPVDDAELRQFRDAEGRLNQQPSPKAMAASGYDYNPLLEGIDQAGEMLHRIRETVDDPDYLSLIDILQKDIGTVPVKVFHLETLADELERGDHSAGMLLAELEGIVGKYRPMQDDIWLRGRWGDKPSGLNVTTMLHEGVHAATLRRLHDGFLDWQAKVDSPYARTYARLDELRGHVATLLETRRRELFADLDLAGRQDLQSRVDYMMSDPQELLTMALSEKPIRDWLKTMPAGNPRGPIRTAWDELLHWIAETLGWQNPTRRQLSKLDELMSFTEEVTALRQPGGDRGAGNVFMQAPEDSFVTQADMIEGRVRSLSPAQHAIYLERKGALDDADARIAELEAELAAVTDKPHRFLDANGNPENYFTRHWDKSRATTEREQLIRALVRWEEHAGRSEGARPRAERQIDAIVNEDADFPGSGAGAGLLRQRILDVPNSWSIEDPEFGTIKISDFIDKRIIQIAEHYVKKSGARIAAAKMFGDAELRAEKTRIKEHILSTHYANATTPEQREAVMAGLREVMGWLDITQKQTLGVFNVADPWRLDNRAATALKAYTTLTTMGKVMFSSIPEIARPGMVNGFGTYFNVLFNRYLGDLERMRGNIEFGGLTGELIDLLIKHNNARWVGMENGEPALGGTSWERWLQERVGGFYKISGLSSLTIWQKVMTMLAAQHVVMDEAGQVGRAIIAGLVPDQLLVRKLAAMGISPRDAVLLSRMPVERYEGGKLILPAVDNWKALGHDGMRARELLLHAIHGEARRTIITPSIGDRSTIFDGVWTKDGKVIGQTGLMTIPIQFLSYGMGAHNKLLTSMIQGRDRSAVMGVFTMFMLGMTANWLRTPPDVWRAKDYDQILYEAADAAGIGGFWLGDTNKMIERVSNNRLGVRASLGIKAAGPKDKGDTAAMLSALGLGPSHVADIARAFYDPSIKATDRAQIIRRGIPYLTLWQWDAITRGMANETGRLFEGSRQ